MALVLESLRAPTSSVASVFQLGKLSVETYAKETSDASSPPKPLLIVTAVEAGEYPVILFLPGFFLCNCYYSDLLQHIASHGYICVAPQLSLISSPFSEDDVKSAVAVTNWLAQGLQSVLPKGVQADLHKLALAGHSKGGHTAFALALKHAQTTLKFSVLIGVDPVAGLSPCIQVSPRILTYKPCSFDLDDMPVLLFGSGLGEDKKNPLLPACAPKGVNAKEFYNECKPTCYYFHLREYGHLDMLNDGAPKIGKCVCQW